ncbi:MAG: (E)-4-hydroxy-3-methylbut-2-enyl-diphosphate synthase [Pseudomonadota bacterium]
MATDVKALYTESLIDPPRRRTRVVSVGDVKIGGPNPIVVQSMVTSPTTDTKATVDQIEALAGAGCEIVRLTIPSMADVENLPNIRAEMKRRKVHVPLVADVHFLPQVALRACDYVEKVRINPGNFADRKRFEAVEYTDQEYRAELERVREAFLPLVRRAKELGVAMRIGANHGSLCDRILNRYGDTPLGMAESALEFARIAEEAEYRDLVFSMKASSCHVTIQAYRVLASRMKELGMDYPLHLGVTEAGAGEDGRIKSAVGIASLLADGLGDTVRVSLTEVSIHEIPVARRLIELFARPSMPPSASNEKIDPAWDPCSYRRRPSRELPNRVHSVGGNAPVRVRTHVIADRPEDLPRLLGRLEPPLEALALEFSKRVSWADILKPVEDRVSVSLRLGAETPGDLTEQIPFDELSLVTSTAWADAGYAEKLAARLGKRPLWLRVRTESELNTAIPVLKALAEKIPAGVEAEGTRLLPLGRKVASAFKREGLDPPIHLHFVAPLELSEEAILLKASGELGGLLCDGIGDSVEISSSGDVGFNHRLAFGILQAARLRMSKTEYISCPSCGRTLFDLQVTTARIRSKTNHLKGVKIAVMGCVVNGPGEMADADFGYVGSGPGLVNLFVGKECVKRHVPEAQAEEQLIQLIKEHGKWADPPLPRPGEA